MVHAAKSKAKDVLLELEDVHMYFGRVAALAGVNLRVRKGEIHSIIGPNGAGKTVMMNCINGLYKPQRGSIFFDGQRVNGFAPSKRARLGIARTFQKIELFGGMTVLDNIRLGRHIHMNSGIFSGGMWIGKTKREEIESRQFIEEEIIDLLEIESIRHKTVNMLPYGLQKRVELGRALALQPRLLLLDEPLAGLNLEEVEDMARFILDINEEERWKVTCILVEHDMGVVMDISHSVFVLNFGHKIVDGPPEEVQANPEVVKAYLGEEDMYTTRR
ncbi:amino acid/amide ABC transporter ATP-binding protein 1, HAAT family [Desulfatibacillum alkenivorans DSM 16219]|jgi:branched-chain amino acid transport system ATP-binding protein|uniref:Amino acid/amide ABC transporter ATP-binding protein 1, HAAT family n=1 Tax=Desulfatibacillum alkenivorans DSM 16219 TaxID=1121393 RepID=A0A1M6FJT4_9BACT|nr:ABC transporter ATP-binding protein [Desulfatibacillum alkenivorans]SHI97945.1 amino acid/amide ABC transporter ATP-binding protein 1, HAAT family [Desulfatibacillum alkenivorans DSM 16219]